MRHSYILVVCIRHTICYIRHSCILVVSKEIISGQNEKANHGAFDHKKDWLSEV